MPKKKRLTERELRRLATRRERHGEDFDSRNARHAASFSQTKFNSSTGKMAAKRRWQMFREEKARKARELAEAQQQINERGEQ